MSLLGRAGDAAAAPLRAAPVLAVAPPPLPPVSTFETWAEFSPPASGAPAPTTYLQHMLAGSVAGVVEHVAMYPIDTYKVRLAAGGV